MKRNYLVPAAIVAAALVIGVPTVATASQNTYPWDSKDIKNQSLLSVDLAANSVGSSEIRGNAVGTSEIAYQGVSGFDIKNNDVTGVDIKDQSIGLKELHPSTVSALEDAVVPQFGKFTANVANVGGSFSERATTAGEFTLKSGKYIITTDALFRSNAATSGNTTLQVAVRGKDGSEWGSDLGTGFTGSSPSQANREVSTSTTRVVSVDVDTVVEVKVFGYENNGTGSADSGLFDAEVHVTAIPVQF